MKQLIIMRHAKAEKDAPSGEDFDRPLSERGEAEARSVAEALKRYGIKPDYALVSSSARTKGTFDKVVAVLGDIPALVSKDYYNADARSLRSAVELHEETCESLLVVGHNPGVQILVGDYLAEGAAGPDVMAQVRGGYPTATATVFAVDAAGRPIYDGIYLAK